MATIGVMDFDFMNYENVIPNLECAKLCTYFHNKKEIAVLTPYLAPAQFTRFYVRKDYDEGIYPKQLFAENCTYGGRAFNSKQYVPLEPVIERTIPNMHIYDKYISHYGKTATAQAQCKRILNCAHIRLSTDGKTPKTITQLKRIIDTGRYTGIIFHDYDLGTVDDACDLIKELSDTRKFVTKLGINPYTIGNKFPIQIWSARQLSQWLKINAMPNIFFMQYNGLFDNQLLFDLCEQNKRMARQVYYNISECLTPINDFLITFAPEIFKQVLFLRRQHIKVLLTYDEFLEIPIEVKNFIELLNCWLSFTWQENFIPLTQSLYTFCAHYKKLQYTTWSFRTITVSVDDARNMFQYMRENNYELFKMFYEWDAVTFKGGEFKNDWRRD